MIDAAAITDSAESALLMAHVGLSADAIVEDYRLGYRSRQASLVGRREVMSGKAKFGIFGDGKELAQLALARAFRPGDFRSGYYRDQTLVFATGMGSIQEYFAQLYAHADVEADPASAGRAMNAHFGTRSLNADGSWRKLAELCNTASDISPTGSQMPRLVGLAQASKLYRDLAELHDLSDFSHNGDEIAWGTIGNATCAEGMFWESINAIGVMGGPAIVSIWDDGYGISVPNKFQITKENLSELLRGFQREEGSRAGFDLYTVCAWKYPELVAIYHRAAEIARTEHVPAIIHVIECTQPQGHSTSGSHERYKSPERLAWEEEYDPLRQMRLWMVAEGIASEAELDALEREDRAAVEAIREIAWQAFVGPIREERDTVADMLDEIASAAPRSAKPGNAAALAAIRQGLAGIENPWRKDVLVAVREALVALAGDPAPEKQILVDWKRAQEPLNAERYGSHLYSRSAWSALNVAEVRPVYSDDSPVVNGFEVVNAGFDAILARDPRVVAFGEDLGKIGDVNQGFRGLQDKYGELRVADTGIRETTIIGQGIGLAMRGLRPIAEVQYLDYVLYCLQIMSDDLATLHWRTRGGQKAPVIVRTRGHRLEGIWHAGSPMAALVHLLRGMHVLVPRDMTRAAGFYNTLLQCDEPALVVEVLSGYRLKERLPDNIAEITVPLGVPETLRSGSDLTLVTYGACCRIALEAAELLAGLGIEIEVIDVQSLLPFDIHGRIGASLKRTGRIVFMDEDVPGGTSAYMLQEVIEKQGGYQWLDSPPRTLAAKPHRPAYGTDGDYFSKPNVEDVLALVVDVMNEVDPERYPLTLGG